MQRTASSIECNKEQGTIIIIVLLVLVVLSFLAMELSKETLIDHTSSVFVKSSIAGNTLCDSGRLLAKEVLAKDLEESKGDYKFEKWGLFNTELEDISEELTSGTLSGEITDENSLFPINKVAILDNNTKKITEQYQGVFLRMLKTLCSDLKLTSGTAEDLLISIRIWQGEQLSRASEDDSWYAAQKIPYTRTKKIFRSADEILLLYWPKAKEGDIEKLYYGTDSVSGLRDLITIWGEGPINMNTANETLTTAIPVANNNKEDFLERIALYRNDPTSNFETTWYLNAAKFSGIEEKNIPKDILDFKSDTFRATFTADIGSGSKKEIVFLRRTNKNITILGSYGE